MCKTIPVIFVFKKEEEILYFLLHRKLTKQESKRLNDVVDIAVSDPPEQWYPDKLFDYIREVLTDMGVFKEHSLIYSE